MDVPPKAPRAALALALCLAGGALFAWIGTPLPWMIGSMLAMALAQVAGAGLRAPAPARDMGMVVVGITLGLHFTAPVVKEVSVHWPWFVALGFAAHAFGTLSAWVLMRLSGADWATAYFGSMPGGASDMVQLGEENGAAADRVAFSHSMRMLLVVTLFPVAITLAGFSSGEVYRPVTVPFDAAGLAILLAVGAAAGFVARALRLPTAFMMGPLVATIALTVSGTTLSSMPPVLINAAQVLLGCVMGSRFDRAFVQSAPRFAASLLPSVAVTLLMAALAGWAIGAGSGAYLGNSLLAAAPGGIAEMSITAKVLKLGVAYVTAAHVVRYAIVVLLTVPMYRLMRRIRP